MCQKLDVVMMGVEPKMDMDLSVICPVFNANPALLHQATHSAMAECAAANVVAELILVDDGSTDQGTRQALRQIGDCGGRVRVIRPGGNSGPATARNHGIAAATGTWLGFLDSDDLWLPGRLAACAAMMRRPDIGWIGGRHRILEADGSSGATPDIAGALNAPSDARLTGRSLTFELLSNFWMHLGAMFVRRDVARRTGGFGDGLFYYEDFLFAARLSVLTPLHLVDADVYSWRQGGTGLTTSSRRLAPAALRMFSLAAKDPLLAEFRRELRWARYSAMKSLALNNLLARRRGQALRLALGAYRLDPREIGDLGRFLALCAQGGDIGVEQAQRYSQAERFRLSEDPHRRNAG